MGKLDSQFHELFNQTFGRFLDFGPTVCHHWPPFVYGLESARHLLEERPNESRVWAAEEKHYWHFLHNLLNKSMGLNLMNWKKAINFMNCLTKLLADFWILVPLCATTGLLLFMASNLHGIYWRNAPMRVEFELLKRNTTGTFYTTCWIKVWVWT